MTTGAREAENYREDSELPLLNVLVMETGQPFRLNKIAGEDGFSLGAKEKPDIEMKCQKKKSDVKLQPIRNKCFSNGGNGLLKSLRSLKSCLQAGQV